MNEILPPPPPVLTIKDERLPRFGIPAGIGGIFVYILSSTPIVFIAMAYVYIQNSSKPADEINRIFSDTIEGPTFLAGALAAQCIAFLIYAFLVSKIRGTGNFKRDLGLKFTKSALWFIPVGLGLQVAGIVISLPIGLLRDEPSEQEVISSFKESSGIVALILVLLLGLIVPMVEEMCFRGLFQRALQKKWRPLIAIITSGSVFAFIHFSDPNAIYAGTVLLTVGLFSAALTSYRGRIDASICLHIGFNITTVIFIVSTKF